MSNDSLILPVGEKILHHSELFQAVVQDKYITPGVTKETHLVELRLLEKDPKVTRVALVHIPPEDYAAIAVGEKVSVRLYEHADGHWRTQPPVVG